MNLTQSVNASSKNLLRPVARRGVRCRTHKGSRGCIQASAFALEPDRGLLVAPSRLDDPSNVVADYVQLTS